LTISAESLEVNQGSSINLTGQLLSDFNSTGQLIGEEAVQVLDSNVITYTFTSPSGKDTNQSVTTNSDGDFHFKFKPNATGIWFITAYYPGSPFILPSTSNMIAVTVNPPNPLVFYIALGCLGIFLAIAFASKCKCCERKTQVRTDIPNAIFSMCNVFRIDYMGTNR